MKNKKLIRNPKFLAVFTVIFWSFSSLLAKLISIDSPYLLFSLSFSFALIIYLFIALRIYGRYLLSTIKKIPFKYYLIGLSGYYAVWLGNTESFIAYDSVSETTVLNYTWLIFTVFFTEILFRRTSSLTLVKKIEFIGILFGFLAIYILAVEGNLFSFQISNTKGLLWGLFGGMSYGFFSAYSSKLSQKRSILFLIASISSSLIAMLITSYLKSGNLIHQIQSLTSRQIALTALLGLLVDALGYIMWTKSLSLARDKKINISKIVSIVFILPLSSLIIVSFFFKENRVLQVYFLLCLFFLLMGFWLTQKSERITKWIKQEHN